MYDILILGAGWTSTFLLPLLHSHNLSFAATTRDGRKVANFPTLKWSFDPNNHDPLQFSLLPAAKHILITFPLTGTNQSATLVSGYREVHGKSTHFIQFGSTGIWQIHQPTCWTDRKSKYDFSSLRAVAEDELLALGGCCVFNLAGLWGGERDPRNWVDRVAKDKEGVRGKKSLHLVHGEDVARGVLAVLRTSWEASEGQRWMLTDGFVYDWWALFAKWGGEGGGEPTKQSRWVYELMREEGVRALPRDGESLGRCYDSREFWSVYGISPLRAGV